MRIKLRERYPVVVAALTLAFSLGAPFALATTVGTNIVGSGTITVPAGYSLDTATAGALNIGTTTANAITIGKAGVTTNNPGLTTMTNASTTQLTIGGSTGTTLNSVQWGTCTLVAATITATSTGYTTCTGAGSIDNTYKVVIEPTSTLPAGLVFDAASTTVTAGTLSLRVNNVNAGANTSTGAITINFWAFK